MARGVGVATPTGLASVESSIKRSSVADHRPTRKSWVEALYRATSTGAGWLRRWFVCGVLLSFVCLAPAVAAAQELSGADRQRLRAEITKELEPLWHFELYFVRIACDVDAQDWPPLRLQAGEALQRHVEQRLQQRTLQADRGNARIRQMQALRLRQLRQQAGQQAMHGAADELQSSLLGIVREQLGVDAADTLQAEYQSRKLAQRLATVAQIVDLLDDHLLLTPEQAELISDELLAGWHPSWNDIVQRFERMRTGRYLPSIQLSATALRQLTTQQRLRWASTPKVNLNATNVARPPVSALISDRWQQMIERWDEDALSEEGESM